jgi:glycogen synthase
MTVNPQGTNFPSPPAKIASRLDPAAVAAPSRPLSVCFVSPEYPMASTANEGIGGIATHTYTLAHAVADLGHRVVVLAHSPLGRDSFDDGAVHVEVVPLRPPRTWKLGRWVPVGWVRRSWSVARALRHLHRRFRFDVVSFPDGAGEAFFYSFWPQVPFVVQLFGPGSLVQRWDGRRVPRARAWVEGFLERRPIRKATLVISSTKRFADLIAGEWSLRLQRVRIIRNPLNIERFKPASSTAGARGKTVLFVGHLQRLKGLLTLVAAMPGVVRAHPDAQFVLLGNDTNSAPDGTSMRAFVTHILRDGDLLSHVTFATPVPQSELVGWYQGCALFVLPSLSDVYPNAVLEAMACGRPCITTHATGVAEIIEHDHSGFLVRPDDAEELAATISRVLSMSSGEREDIGRRARATVERLCTSGGIGRQTVQAYRETLAALGRLA